METNIFTDNWESRLESQFLKNNRCCKKVYICSPLSAETDEEMLSNMRNARAYMYYAMTVMGYAARAPHAYLPMLLCDKIPSERAAALTFGAAAVVGQRYAVCMRQPHQSGYAW